MRIIERLPACDAPFGTDLIAGQHIGSRHDHGATLEMLQMQDPKWAIWPIPKLLALRHPDPEKAS